MVVCSLLCALSLGACTAQMAANGGAVSPGKITPDSLATTAAEQVAAGDLQGGMATYRQALDLDAHHAASLRGMVDVAAAAGDPVTARHYHDTLVATGVASASDYAEMAEVLESAGDKRGASDVLSAGLSSFPDDGALNLEAARVALSRSRTGQATGYLKKAMSAGGPSGRKAHRMLCNTYFDDAEYDAALPLLESYQRKYPGDFQVNMRAAYIHLSRDEFKAASHYYRNAVGANPKSVDARVSLAKCQHELGDLDAAIRSYDKALKVSGLTRQVAEVVLAQANLLNERGKHDRALHLLEECEASFPLTPGLQCARGMALAAVGLYDDAVRAFAAATSDYRYGEFAQSQIRRIQSIRR